MEKKQKSKIFVLTMDQEGGRRRNNCINLFSNLGLDISFVNSILLDDPEIAKNYSRLKNLIFSKQNLSPAEISCYLGHRKIWKEFLETDQKSCLIVEDDLKINHEESFKKAIGAANDSRSWDILKLHDYKTKKILNKEHWHTLTIVDYKYPSSCTTAYLINRYAAEKLLQRKKIYRAVDEDFSNCWEFNIKVRSIIPNPIGENSQSFGGSIIEKTRLGEKEHRYLSRRLWGIILQIIKQIYAFKYRLSLKGEKIKNKVNNARFL